MLEERIKQIRQDGNLQLETEFDMWLVAQISERIKNPNIDKIAKGKRFLKNCEVPHKFAHVLDLPKLVRDIALREELTITVRFPNDYDPEFICSCDYGCNNCKAEIHVYAIPDVHERYIDQQQQPQPQQS